MSDPTAVEVAAMWLYGREYSEQNLGIVDYFRSLPENKKRLLREMAQQIRACKEFSR